MDSTGKVLRDLELWYWAQCNGDWEHRHGVEISTLDNPGWSVRIDLHRTILRDKPFEPVSERIPSEGEEDEPDTWWSCQVVEQQFQGHGDPGSLARILQVFLEWAKSESRWWLTTPADIEFEEERMRAAWAELAKGAGPEPCVEEGCTEPRVTYGVLCRAHHWRMLHGGRPYPFLGEE
jgi:hypothetical protein